MKLPSRIAVATLAVLSTSLSLKAGEPVKHTNPVPASFSDDKPAYLYFKEGSFTRTGVHRVEFEAQLAGEIGLAARKQEVIFLISFDIDNTASTGKEYITFPGLGVDATVWLKKEPNLSKFNAYSDEVVVGGKTYEIEIIQSKVSNDKIQVAMKSELFAKYPEFRVYVQSKHTFLEKGRETSEVVVDQFPRRGALTIPQ